MILEHITETTIKDFEFTAIERTLDIQNSHPFLKTEDKTQIVRPKKIENDIYKTRQTHSLETATIGELICNKIGFKYVNQIKNVCLLHDIGHSPFGHDGQKLLNATLKSKGLEEGFNDNNANFDIIFNNNIEVSSYELVSIIKRKDELYDYQKKIFLPFLEEAIELETEQWGYKEKTMGSIIMDMSDEISYGMSDFVDGYTLDYNKYYIDQFVSEMIEFSTSKEIVDTLLEIQESLLFKQSKKELRKLVSKLKIQLVRSVSYNKEQTKLVMDFNNYDLLNKFISFNYKNFIKSKKLVEDRQIDLDKFQIYIDFIIDNKYFPSNMYREQYLEVKKTNDIKNILRTLRNMIGDTTDNFVLDFVENKI